jgi:hypothetical protein
MLLSNPSLAGILKVWFKMDLWYQIYSGMQMFMRLPRQTLKEEWELWQYVL